METEHRHNSILPEVAFSECLELSVVMPCLNEAETLERCIQKAQAALQNGEIAGEVIVADNGSTDGSPEIAARNGARVVHVAQRGYGAALRAGIAVARGKYVVMADADDSYDLGCLQPFVEKLRAGYQLVIGTRIKGRIMPHAMPWLHYHIGNPLLTRLGNLLFKTRLSDYHCGMRGFDRDAIQSLALRTPGMEFATEMVAKAALQGLAIAEIPITYYPDGRTRPPHLRTWRDGWRHLRFMLLLSPAWVLLYPGMLLITLGALGGILLLPGPVQIGSIGLDVHTLLVCGISIIVGVQLLIWWLCSRLVANNIGLLPLPRWLPSAVTRSPLAVGILAGSGLIICGLLPSLHSFILWSEVQFGALDYRTALRALIPGLVFIAVGIQVLFSSFVVALLNVVREWVG